MKATTAESHKRSRRRAADEKPDEHAPSPPTITPRQQQALQALLTGATDTEAADVARETVNRWRHRDANFIAALNEARQDLAQDFHGGLRALLPDALAYKLRRGCTFDDATHRTGCIEYRGKRVNFEVADDALIVTQTGEIQDPRSVARMRPMVALEKQRRTAERVINTEKHKRWER